MSWRDWFDGLGVGIGVGTLLTVLMGIWFVDKYGKCYKSFCVIPWN